jgi:hypothetical protein
VILGKKITQGVGPGLKTKKEEDIQIHHMAANVNSHLKQIKIEKLKSKYLKYRIS